MKSPFVYTSIIGTFLFGVLAFGANRTLSIDRYLVPFVTAEVEKGGNSAEWEGSGNGGYLMRYLIDVTGDGRPELLVTSSLASSSNQSEWKVFDVQPSGEMRPYDGTIRLMADAVWVARDDGRVELRCEWPTDFDSVDGQKNRLLPEGQVRHRISRFAFAYPKITETATDVTDVEAEKLKPAAKETRPLVEVMLLSDYLTNPDAAWQAVSEWQSNSLGYFTRSGDAEAIKQRNNFTPQIALAQLGAGPSPSDSDNKSSESPSAASFPKSSTSKSIPRTDAALAAPNGVPIPLTRWGVIVALVLVVISLLPVLLKKRL